ncbi:MAG: patatin-like phospholipase family protein [Acidobacteria bacterium]|nr:patatin-like phospholipase family protein [Acidobacteriota bacterium]
MLQEERQRFRASLPDDVARLWKRFPGRIAVVLSGGGARGAYEAGVLLAFQDAHLPSHILTSTSIGAINAASYAAHGRGYVGNAEPLVQGWLDLTPATVGIDWSRYIIILAGLIAATAGFGNAAADLMHRFGIFFHQDTPLLTWLLLGAAGLSVLFSYTELSYAYYVLLHLLGRNRWMPEKKKLISSLIANAIILGFLFWVLITTHVHFKATPVFMLTTGSSIALSVTALSLLLLWSLLRNRISLFSHKILKSPLDSGLFQNYERTRFLKRRIHQRRLRRSPIRLVMTAAELYTGREKYFINKKLHEVANDPGVDAEFIRSHFEHAHDLIRAVIASSAFPMAYEPVRMHGGLWSDGGLVAKQPITPAIRLGADVVFLITVDPAQEVVPKIKTFLDVGMRAFDILMSRNVIADLRVVQSVNQICESYASRMGWRPEEIILEIGAHTYRYLKAFTIRPDAPLAATLLDFDGRIARPAIEQGYKDGATAIRAFMDYVLHAPPVQTKRVLRLSSEQEIGSSEPFPVGNG